jgi:hypothetical protein
MGVDDGIPFSAHFIKLNFQTRRVWKRVVVQQPEIIVTLLHRPVHSGGKTARRAEVLSSPENLNP